MAGRTARRRITRVTGADQADDTAAGATASERADLLATEEPLGIRIGGQAVSLTMRTPGDDIDLTAGFLISESIITSATDVAAIRICDGTQCGHDHASGELTGNIADVTLRPGLELPAGTAAQLPDQQRLRRLRQGQHCGICKSPAAPGWPPIRSG